MTLQLGNGAFDVPTTAVEPVMKVGEHLAAVSGFGQLAFEATRIERNHCRANSEFVSTDFVGVFGVIALVGEKPIEGDVLGRLPHGGFQERDIVTRASRDDRSGNQIGRGMANDGEFGPMPLSEGLQFAAPIEVMGTDMTRFEPGGIDGSFRPFVYEAKGVGSFEHRGEQGGQSPFFNSRFSA